MTTVVVDTNVAIAANGKNTHADLACQLACVEELRAVCRDMVIAVDDSNRIFDEYKDRLSSEVLPEQEMRSSSTCTITCTVENGCVGSR